MTIRSSNVGLVIAALATVSSTARLGSQSGPPGTPAEVTVAQTAFQAGQVDSAIRTLEAFFGRNPTATVGRLLLGNAYARKGELDKAVASYQQVTVPRPTRLQATFSIAAIHARRGKADDALKLLRRSEGNRRVRHGPGANQQ